MTQLSFLEPVSKGQLGAVWWAGSWECRNWHGWLQSREQGRGPWCFTIYGFSGEPETHSSCSVYALDESGSLITREVPIDPRNRITIEGRKFGRSHWMH